jgi:hypothetical protein
MAAVIPIEVCRSDQDTAIVNDVMLKVRNENAVAMELHTCD